jgi:L-fucose isomerase-like protein
MKTKVKVVFPANRPDRPSWPYIGYDVEKRSKQVLAVLEQQLPEFEFSPGVYYTPEEAERAFQDEKAQFDGYLVYMTALWNGVAEFYVRNAWPVIVADELYAGSGGLLRVHSLIKEERLPAVSVASSDFQDVLDAVRLIGVIKKMRQAKILVIADGESWGARQETLAHASDIFGTRTEQVNSDTLKDYYESVDEDEAAYWKDKWIREALKVVEPDEDEVLRSARMYLAMKAAMQDVQADAVTVDCLGLYYGGKLFAYPCLGFFQLNNEGSTGVCEADVDSTLTQLLIRYLTGQPGYVSDPVIDTATGQIIYAHCVAMNRAFGPQGLANPYVIRSHAEDRKGASVQSLLPLGHPITTLKISAQHKAFAIHTGRAVANVEDDKACRTKLAAEVEAQKILDTYHSELFGWHRVTCYGAYRKPFIDLATLYGLDIFEEDR